MVLVVSLFEYTKRQVDNKVGDDYVENFHHSIIIGNPVSPNIKVASGVSQSKQ